MDMSEEPFCVKKIHEKCVEIDRKNAGRALRRPRFGWKFRHMLQEPFCVGIYRKNAAHYFLGPHFVRKFKGKNAHGHGTRAILCGNLKENAARPDAHLDQTPALYPLP